MSTIITMARNKGYNFVSIEECVYGDTAATFPLDASIAYSRNTCNKAATVANTDCVLSAWSRWDIDCPSVCGDRVRTRRRYVVTDAAGTGTCNGALVDTIPCNNPCRCGDGLCNRNETCASCPQDCGPCHGASTTAASGCVANNTYAITFHGGPTAVYVRTLSSPHHATSPPF